MRARPVPWVLPLLLAGGCAGVRTVEGGLRRFAFERAAMGTTFRIVLYAGDAAVAGAAARAAFERIAELDAALSDWDPWSELSRLSDRARSGPTDAVPVSRDLLAVLLRAREVSAASEGAFDVTVGAPVRLWRRSARQVRLPDPDRLAAAQAGVGWRALELDAERGTVRLTRAGTRLDLGGIAKGYALDGALAVLARYGVERALVDGGGDVAVSGPPPGERGWRVAVAPRGEPPGERVVLGLAHAACATSGDLHQRVVIGGVVYSHLVDPRTGLGSTRGVAATVVAPTGTEADAWASALCVLGAERGLVLVAERPRLEARVLERGRGGGACLSAGFARMMVEP